MIDFKQHGDFSKTIRFLKNAPRAISSIDFNHYGKLGVDALRDATPKNTGLTSESWTYEITRKEDRVTISFHNTNVQNGVPIAIILQYGHGTKNGGWVQGRNYINPAIQPIFDKLANDAWEVVSKR